MEIMRRKLARSLQHEIKDVLAHVAVTHRDLVRQFNRRFDDHGGKGPVLDPTQVMNALMSVTSS
ncbi:hypothetical protein PHMEG_00030452 [Phytophthora megakarya]|uniref:Uncharacterized protein n=1 Tax=Phytophthora megakarya TaxID=4795 RepID=A0A225UYR2_9STRA|nr:hypothetical protein PHMEG_00030452 [Phytophthora megakarya]